MPTKRNANASSAVAGRRLPPHAPNHPATIGAAKPFGLSYPTKESGANAQQHLPDNIHSCPLSPAPFDALMPVSNHDQRLPPLTPVKTVTSFTNRRQRARYCVYAMELPQSRHFSAFKALTVPYRRYYFCDNGHISVAGNSSMPVASQAMAAGQIAKQPGY